MSFEPPAGILDIGNATLRVGKLEVAETSGLNQGLQNIVKNDLLITESTMYTSSQNWGLKLPTTWVAEFDLKGETGKYVEFNFYNEGFTSNTSGYTLNFTDTSLTLKYDNGTTLASATIPTIVGTFRKVHIFFERNVIAVSIDGTRYLYDKRPSVLSRVISTTGSAFLNLFVEDNSNASLVAFKNLRIVNGRFISDETSNIAFVGGNLGVGVHSPTESLDVLGSIKTGANVHVTGNVYTGGEIELYSNLNIQRVSNVASIKLNSNVVTEFPRSKKLIKYPRVALTSASQDGYVVTESSEFSTTSWQSYYVFDNNTADSGNNNWASLPGRYTSSGQTYSGGSSLGNYDGEYIQIELPVKINLSLVRIFPRTYVTPSAQTPKDFVIIASNDGVTYDLLKSVTNQSDSGTWINIDIHTTNLYNRFALVISKVISSDTAGIAEIEYHGIPEYDPEAHGTDVVVKSVPNVPNTDWLEVYYDAKNYSGSGDVQDETANNRDGVLYGNTSFSSADGIHKFDFDGAGDYIESLNITSISGNQTMSSSVWVKFTSWTNTTYDFIYSLGDRTVSGNGTEYSLVVNHQTNGLYIGTNGLAGIAATRFIPDLERWYHFAATYDGHTNRIFIDGTFRNSESPIGDLNLPTSGCDLVLGGDTASSRGQFMNGSIANFRLFNRALTSDEIWQLYAYQKEYFGHGDLSMTLKAGRLNVKGDISCDGVVKPYACAFAAYASSGGNSSTSGKFPADRVYFNIGNCYNTSTYVFTAPVHGIYHMSFSAFTNQNPVSSSRIYGLLNGATTTQVGATIEQHGNSLSHTVEMQAGDTFHFNGGSGVPIYYFGAGGHNRFCGHLICAL
jgi:hypothetical protein